MVIPTQKIGFERLRNTIGQFQQQKITHLATSQQFGTQNGLPLGLFTWIIAGFALVVEIKTPKVIYRSVPILAMESSKQERPTVLLGIVHEVAGTHARAFLYDHHYSANSAFFCFKTYAFGTIDVDVAGIGCSETQFVTQFSGNVKIGCKEVFLVISVIYPKQVQTSLTKGFRMHLKKGDYNRN